MRLSGQQALWTSDHQALRPSGRQNEKQAVSPSLCPFIGNAAVKKKGIVQQLLSGPLVRNTQFMTEPLIH